MPGLTVYEYGKGLLNTEERQIYDQIAACIRNIDSSVTITTSLDPNTIAKICEYYYYDHSEVFYFNNVIPNLSYHYSYVNGVKTYISYTITPTYSMGKNQAISMRSQMGAAALQLLQAASGKTSDYDKVKALHDAVVLNTSYNMAAVDDPSGNPNSFTAYGVFVDKKAVCDGYARAMKILLGSAGVKSIYITGQATNDNGATWVGHAWNIVSESNHWYYLDATFDDPVAWNGSSYVDTGRVFYDYFNFTSKPDHLITQHTSTNYSNYEVMPTLG